MTFSAILVVMSKLNVGDLLDGRYRIETPIARGGMSTVYRCIDTRLGRPVAAKVMDDRYIDDPIFRDRFRREARSMAQLSHPCLVNVYDTGEDGDHLFLIMELINGGTLRELLAERGPMPPHAAAAVMRSMLTGLSVAHSAGMVHRDIKPDNILINGDHQVKLADFGLVRETSQNTATSDQIIGTVSYLSPEQVEGGDIGPESDVYSAGIVLYELLTGEIPFTGDTQVAQAFKRLNNDVPAPSTRIDGVPPLFDALVAQATSRNPEERFTDAGEFLSAVDSAAAELSLPAFKVPVPRNAAAHRATEIEDDAATEEFGTREFDADEMGTEVFNSGPTETSILEPVVPAPAPAQASAPETRVAAATPAHQAPSPAPPTPVSPPGPKPVSNRSGIRLGVWLTVIFILTCAVAVGGWWFGSGRYGEIPEVIGMDRVQATAAIQNGGFEPTIQQVYNDDTAVDQIVGTNPPFGSRAVRGSNVAILISLGRPTIPTIPTDHSVDRYRALLSERTLTWQDGDQVYSDDVPAGGVAETSPAVGQEVRTGTAVSVSLSKGPAPVAVPDVKGLSRSAAESALKSAGLKVARVDEGFISTTPKDHVFGILPAPGTEVTRGTEVVIQVSTALEVPDIVGMSQEEGTKKLQEAGIKVDQIKQDNTTGTKAHQVVGTAPGPGTLIDPSSSSVDIVVAKKVKVPNVVGSKLADAKEKLEEAGLSASSSGSDSSRVITQSPHAGSEVDNGKSVTLKTIG